MSITATAEKFDRCMQQTLGGGALSTCTYGEVSPIFLDQNVTKSDIFGPNETEVMFMIFFVSNIFELIFLGSL